jgi:hypothetical protein
VWLGNGTTTPLSPPLLACLLSGPLRHDLSVLSRVGRVSLVQGSVVRGKIRVGKTNSTGEQASKLWWRTHARAAKHKKKECHRRSVSTQSHGSGKITRRFVAAACRGCCSYSFPLFRSSGLRADELLSCPSFFAFHLDLEMTIITSDVDGRRRIGRPCRAIISVRSPPLFLTSSFSYPSSSSSKSTVNGLLQNIHPPPHKLHSDHSGRHQERKVGIPGEERK